MLALLLLTTPTVEFSLSQPEVEITDQVTLDFVVSRPEGYRLDVDDLLSQIASKEPFADVPPYQVADHSLTAEVRGGELVDHLSVQLDPWQSGDYQLGFYTLKLHAADRPGLSLLTGAADLSVAQPPMPGPLPDDQLFALDGRTKPPLNASSRRARDEALAQSQRKGLDRLKTRRLLWRTLLITLTTAAALYFLRKLFRRRSKPISNRDPRQEALAALDHLASENLPAKGQIEPFYVRLTGIVRHYMEEAHGIRAPEQTTQEFLRQSLDLLNTDMRDHLKEFLISADLVKFARLRPGTTETESALTSARTVILEE
jgi:hypothetical protein